VELEQQPLQGICCGGRIPFLPSLLKAWFGWSECSVQRAPVANGEERGSDSESSWLKDFEIRSTVIWHQYSSTHPEVKAAPYTMSDFLRTRLVEFV
jgi:uncharacterized protein (DUF2235 family)